MASVTVTFIVGIVGNIISILVFLAPISTFRRIVKKKSIENFKALPYICTLLSTSLWVFYGLLKPDGLLIVTVNGVGSIMQFVYVLLFITYAPKDTKIKLMTALGILNLGFLAVVIAVVLTAIHGSIRIAIVGCICAGLTLGMYASPLVAMRNVIKTRSVEFMPFNLSFFLFLNSCVWGAYAVLIKDFYVGIPNWIGIVLGAAQLVVYAAYRSKSKLPAKATEDPEEEGSADFVRGTVEMAAHKENGVKLERVLSKVRSLPSPKTSVSRQTSFQKLAKTNSSSQYELQPIWPDQHNIDLENPR